MNHHAAEQQDDLQQFRPLSLPIREPGPDLEVGELFRIHGRDAFRECGDRRFVVAHHLRGPEVP